MSEDPIEELSDNELARRSALGDRRAFGVVVDRHGNAMFRFACRIANPEDAADIVQDALVRAWQALPGYRGEARLRTWLLTLTANRARTLRRRRRAVPIDDSLLTPTPAPAQEGPLARVLETELVDALDLALAELPVTQRAVWLLREVEDQSYSEIAHTLDVSVATVRGQLHRARRNLATRLERWR